jgi:hypothetical protein
MDFSRFIPICAGLALIAFSAFLFLSPALQDSVTHPEKPLSMNFSMNRASYVSNSAAVAFVNLSGGSPGTNATLRISGIPSNSGGLKISGSREVSLGRGLEENFTFQMPRCYGCAGVAPGDYNVLAEVLVNGTLVMNASFRIRLEA